MNKKWHVRIYWLSCRLFVPEIRIWIEFLTKLLETTLFCRLKTWMTWAGRKNIHQTCQWNWEMYWNSLIMESRISASSGTRSGTVSPGIHDLRSVDSPNTSPASLILYKAGLSQNIFRMSSLRTKTRLPLCKAIISDFSRESIMVDFFVAIMSGFFFVLV